MPEHQIIAYYKKKLVTTISLENTIMARVCLSS